MTTKQLTLKQQPLKVNNPVASFMTIAAWISLAIGLVTCLFEVSDFSDRNLGLMVGVGFLVGSVQIYMIGAAIRLFHHSKSTKNE